MLVSETDSERVKKLIGIVIRGNIGELCKFELTHEDSFLCYTAAENGRVDMLQFLITENRDIFSWNVLISYTAAEKGQREILRWAVDNNYPLHRSVCDIAIKYGHVECVKYLHENGHTWSETGITLAVESGNLLVLRYLFDSGCTYNNDEVMKTAARKEHIHVLQFLREHGILKTP